MSFDAPSFSGSDAARRKIYAIAGAGVCVLVFVIAYAFSGSKPAPKKVVEPDQAVSSILDKEVTNLDQVGGNPDWLDNTPEGTILAQNPQAGPAVQDAPTTPLSSVVIGDTPAAEPSADSAMKPGQAPGPGVAAPNAAGGAAAPVSSSPSQGAGTVATAAVAGESLKPAPTPPPAVPGGAVAALPPVNAPVAAIPAVNAPMAAVPPVSAPVAAIAPVNAPVAAIGQVSAPVAVIPPVNAPVAAIGQVNAPTAAIPPVNAPTATIGQVHAPVAEIGAPAASPAASSSARKEKNSASTQRPKFVRPSRQQPGIIARTSDLVSEAEYRQAPKPAAAQEKPQQAAAKPAVTRAPATPARVHQQEARSFAAQTTEQLREQGLIKPDQRIRLPRSSETPNPTIWREDDAPVTPEERRHFGLVLAEENPASTPEGIPLRTDIPAGTSPLEKTGADKPLWKRPE